MRVTNFGGNVSFVPRHSYVPRDETEVLAVLDRHATGRIRAVGSLHSWSDIVATDDVLIDLRHFSSVTTATRDGEVLATIGAGCQLGDLLRVIHEETDATLPTLGAITKQTISGAISTGTHGSGRHSLSHYVVALRIAAYDDTGRARIFEVTEGEQLRAARCALGCMGIILSVTIRCVPKYLVEETVRRFETLDEVLAGEDAYPLQQFVLVPYLWSFFVFQRRVVSRQEKRQSVVRVPLYRLYNRLGIDVAFHLVVKVLASPPVGAAAIRAFYRRALSAVLLRGATVVQPSHRALTMRHELFRHLEMEAFISARHLRSAVELVRYVVSVFADESAAPPDEIAGTLRELGMLESLESLRGTYAHHYPIFFRRVLPDDTLLSMTAGASEPYYSVSFFTYRAQRRRAPFFVMADYLARALSRRYGARVHWGKYFPLGHRDVARLYPTLADFRRTCERTDPRGVFRNAYTTRVLCL